MTTPNPSAAERAPIRLRRRAGDAPRSQELLDAMNDGRWQDATHLLLDKVDALYRERAGDAPGWQPIESAPKDGTEVLLSDGEQRWIGYFKRSMWWPVWVDAPIPTHWMPLPAPPSASQEGSR